MDEKKYIDAEVNELSCVFSPNSLKFADLPDEFFIEVRSKQMTEIMWHPYPEEKPPKEDVPYLITCEYLWGEERLVMEAFWGDINGVTLWFEIDSRGNEMPLTLQVFAWAEMPEPYKENKK